MHNPWGKRSGVRLAALLTSPLLAVAVAAGAASPAGAATKTIDQYLGSASPAGAGAPWAMISLGNFTANGGGTDNGNVAVASGAATLNNPFAINGKLYLGQGVSYSSNITPTGGETSDPALVSQAASDARTASSDFSGLTATQNVGTLGNNSSVTGGGGFNVIDATGISLTNGTLTLTGNASSVFVINVNGDFTVSNGGVVLSGGVLATNVVWNISGNLTISGGGAGGATFYGTALDVTGQVTVHDDTWNGEIIGGTITDTSGFTVNSFPPVTQTISGHIYSCANGKPTTTEVPGGTLAVTAGPATIPAQPNPLLPTNVPAGTYTMAETSPPGYHLVACNGVPNSPTQPVVVPAGGAGVGIFYVARVSPPKTGYLEICKQQSGTGLQDMVFTFRVDGHGYTVPVGACTPAIKVNAGNVTVRELKRAGSRLVSVTTIPANRLVSDNLATRTAVVKVVPGGLSTQTVVTFTNKFVPGSGYLKICQVAGKGITVGSDFSFTAGSQKVSVPAGPAPGGYCVIAGKLPFGNLAIVQMIPGEDKVSSIRTAPASRQVSVNTATGQVTVNIGSGVTEVTYTDIRTR